MNWISVEDKKPDLGQRVLCTDGKDIEVSTYDKSSNGNMEYQAGFSAAGIEAAYHYAGITHWIAIEDIPLPIKTDEETALLRLGLMDSVNLGMTEIPEIKPDQINTNDIPENDSDK